MQILNRILTKQFGVVSFEDVVSFGNSTNNKHTVGFKSLNIRKKVGVKFNYLLLTQ